MPYGNSECLPLAVVKMTTTNLNHLIHYLHVSADSILPLLHEGARFVLCQSISIIVYVYLLLTYRYVYVAFAIANYLWFCSHSKEAELGNTNEHVFVLAFRG